MAFKEIAPEELMLNPFTKIGKEWMLITAGADAEHCNTMTASWGAMGVMWGKNVVSVYIRPQRYTKEFIDANEHFTCAFFGEGNQREALSLLGKVSGRDVPDKISQAGLTPVEVGGSVAFEEAELVFVCRKLYARELPPEDFIDTSCDARWYPNHDYHTMYMARDRKSSRKGIALHFRKQGCPHKSQAGRGKARARSRPARAFCYNEKSAAVLPLAARALYSLTMASRLTVEVARGWGSSSGENQPTSVLSSSPTKGVSLSSVGVQMKRMSRYRHWSPFKYFTR